MLITCHQYHYTSDLVDAKREFGWTTAAVAPEVGFECKMEGKADFIQTQRSIELLLNALRLVQDELGAKMRTVEDIAMLDEIENLVSRWRDRETSLLGNSFVFLLLSFFFIRD